MKSQLTQLVYYSKVVNSAEIDYENLLATAIRRNKETYLTGALWLHGDYFIQVLEGSRLHVSETYQRICGDPRHEDIVLVGCKTVDERSFADWWMALVMTTPKKQAEILRYSGTPVLDPEFMPHDSLVALMRSEEFIAPHMQEG